MGVNNNYFIYNSTINVLILKLLSSALSMHNMIILFVF
jgi:hypothetical protein